MLSVSPGDFTDGFGKPDRDLSEINRDAVDASRTIPRPFVPMMVMALVVRNSKKVAVTRVQGFLLRKRKEWSPYAFCLAFLPWSY